MKQIHGLFLTLLLLLTLPATVQAVKLQSEDVVLVSAPVDDDLFAAGNAVIINAPVESAVIAGGQVELNAPVKGDLIVAGGKVNVSTDVGGKIVAAGGAVNLRGNVTRNVVLAGGEVNIHPTSKIGRDAIIAGKNVTNQGNVVGQLKVSAQNFVNTGSAGRVDFQMLDSGKAEEIDKGAIEFKVVILLGFLIVGLLIIRLFKPGMDAVHSEIIESPPKKAFLGFLLIIATAVLILLAGVTIIGLPFALILMMLFIVALMLSNLFVASTLGNKIAMALNLKIGDLLSFTVGFILLNFLFLIPLAGGLIELISISLGFGAMVYALSSHRYRSGRRPEESG